MSKVYFNVSPHIAINFKPHSKLLSGGTSFPKVEVVFSKLSTQGLGMCQKLQQVVGGEMMLSKQGMETCPSPALTLQTATRQGPQQLPRTPLGTGNLPLRYFLILDLQAASILLV